MQWYQKVLTKYKRETIFSVVFFIVFALLILLWHYFLGKSFVWKNIEPFEVPGIFERAIYSAFVYVTIGAFLYWTRFYQLLYLIFVGFLGVFRLYKGIKKIIWWGLMAAMYFWIFPRIVDLLNAICSFFYNMFGLILYTLPPLGVSLILCIPLVIFLYKKKSK